MENLQKYSIKACKQLVKDGCSIDEAQEVVISFLKEHEDLILSRKHEALISLIKMHFLSENLTGRETLELSSVILNDLK